MREDSGVIRQRNWVADFAKGCGLRLLLLIVLIAGFYFLLCLRSPFPTLLLFPKGAEVAGPIAGFFMWFALLYLLHARQNEKDIALMRQGLRHGERALVSGTIRPEGPLLTAPFSGETCVGYHYTVLHSQSSGKSRSLWRDYEGCALAPFTIRSPLSDVRILAEPDMELFYELPREILPDAAYERAAAYVKATDFGETVESPFGKSRERKTVNGPGDFRVDLCVGDPPADLRTCSLREKIIRPGEAVYAVGVYSDVDNGLVADPNIMNTPFHIVRGGEDSLRRKTQLRLLGAAICACISIAVVTFYFLVYAPGHPGRLI